MAPDRRLRSHDRWIVRIEQTGSLLYDRVQHCYLRCDWAETFLLTAAATIPLPAARRLLGREIGPARAVAAAAALRSIGMFRRSQRFAGRIVDLTATPGAFTAPLVAHLGLTHACNFACRHCYARAGRRRRGELDRQALEQLFDQLRDVGCCKIVLGGGEPFLRDDLPAVVAAANQRDLDCYVHTNGSLLRRSLVQRLALAPPVGLAVSLDGPDAASNDAIRGRGAFAAACRGLALLRQHYPPGFNINFTVTPGNAHQAGRMVDLAARAGAAVLLLRPAYPAGQATRHVGVTCDRATFAAAVAAARQRAAERGGGVDVDATHPDEIGIPAFDGFGCVAGRVVLGIAPDGAVSPCLNLPAAFAAGTVRSAPLIEIWRHGESFRALRRLRAPAVCRRCDRYPSCRGGCRTRALADRGAIDERDSWCAIDAAGSPANFPGARIR